jgi:hypothetical protein
VPARTGGDGIDPLRYGQTIFVGWNDRTACLVICLINITRTQNNEMYFLMQGMDYLSNIALFFVKMLFQNRNLCRKKQEVGKELKNREFKQKE